MSFIARLVVVSVALSEIPCSVSAPQVSYEYSYNPFVKQYTRNVTLKQGLLKGEFALSILFHIEHLFHTSQHANPGYLNNYSPL